MKWVSIISQHHHHSLLAISSNLSLLLVTCCLIVAISAAADRRQFRHHYSPHWSPSERLDFEDAMSSPPRDHHIRGSPAGSSSSSLFLPRSTPSPGRDDYEDRDNIPLPVWNHGGPTDQQWSGVSSSSTSQLCPLLPFDMSDSAFPAGTTITVTCPEGYEFISAAAMPASTSSTCRRDGSWTRSQLGACKKRVVIRYCDEPPEIANSVIAETVIVQVDTSESRHQTYVHQSPSQTVAKRMKREVNESNWLTKIYQVIQDGGPTGPRRPLAVPLLRYTVGSSIRYACEHGFRLEGASDRVYCRYPDWTKAPHCARICYAPDTPAYAVIDRQLTSEDGFEFPVNGFITFKCLDDTFYMTGEPKIVCTSTGNWTGVMPLCRQKVIPRIEMVECQTPSPPDNAVIAAQVIGQTIDRHPVGGYIRYKCLAGYLFQEDVQSTITCQPDGTWNYPVPSCDRVPIAPPAVSLHQCEAPPIPANGVILRQYTSSQVNQFYPVGGYIEYACNERFELFGQRTITCTYSGWSSNPPTCQKTCPEPQLSGAANVIIESRPSKRSPLGHYVVDSQFQLACAASYQHVNGSLSFKCLPNGKWFPQHIYPVCRRIHQQGESSGAETKTVCGEPPVMAYGFVSRCSHQGVKNRYPLGTTVHYQCQDNFTLVGNSTYICSEDGFWVPLGNEYESYCELTCPAPPTPEFAQISERSKYLSYMDRYRHGGHIRYNCSDSGSVIGEDTIWCHEDGTWSLKPPICQVPCAEPPVPANAHVVFQSESLPLSQNDYGELDVKNRRFPPGAVTRFTCDDGYNNIDDDIDTIYCQNGGQWLTRRKKEIGEICLFFPNWMSQK